MIKPQLFDMLETIGSVLSLYRNISWLRTKFKKITAALIICTVLVYLITLLIMLYTCDYLNGLIECVIVNTYSAVISAVMIVAAICGFGFAESFRIHTASMNSVHKFCRDMPSYKKSMKYLLISNFIFILMYGPIYVSYLVRIIMNFREPFSNTDFTQAFWVTYKSTIMLLGDMRFTFEIFTFVINLNKITIYLRHLKISLMTISKRLDTMEDGADESSCGVIKRDLMEIARMYNAITLCCDKLKKLYGIQILLCLFVFVFYIIAIAYVFFRGVASNDPKEIEGIKLILIAILYFLFVIFLLVYNGQKVHNASDSLKRLMSVLCCKILHTPGECTLELTRSINDVHRQMEVRPANIRVLTTMPLQMSLMLAIISAGVSCTITLLQFTHVV